MPPPIYRIHPTIGVARIGDSNESYDGPEVRDLDFRPPGGYRDAAKKIKKQAAVFRIYKYETSGIAAAAPKVSEVTIANVKKITWRVKLANRKGFRNDRQTRDVLESREGTAEYVTLEVAAPGPVGPKSLDARWDNGRMFLTWNLGTISSDAAGRLRALGGRGRSEFLETANPINALFNKGWYDDVGDGPVEAELVLNDDTTVTVERAWLVTGVPDFAHSLESIVTLYDVALDVARVYLKQKAPQQDSFFRDVYPILVAAERVLWTSRKFHVKPKQVGDPQPFFDIPMHRFATGPLASQLRSNAKSLAPLRRQVFDRLRVPDEPSSPTQNMPDLQAELDSAQPNVRPLQLNVTETQYKLLQRWVEGAVLADFPSGAFPAVKPLSQRAPSEQPAELDRAHLCSMMGGGLGPGIEVGEEAAPDPLFPDDLRIWSTTTPFRLRQDLVAGTLTQSLAVPWQADFARCANVWWPSHRPDVVLPGTATAVASSQFQDWVPFFGEFEEDDVPVGDMGKMVDHWRDLGFVVKGTVAGQEAFVQVEADPKPV